MKRTAIHKHNMTSVLFLFFIATLLISVTNAEFYLTLFGASPRRVRRLAKNDHICPSRYPTGFNIECVTGPFASGAVEATSIYINGHWARTEANNQVYIGVDQDGNPCPWTSYPSIATISCRPNGSILRSVSVYLKFMCKPSPNLLESNAQSLPESSSTFDISMAVDITEEPDWTTAFSLPETSYGPESLSPPGKVTPEVSPSESPSPLPSLSTSTSPIPSFSKSASPIPSSSKTPVSVPSLSSSAIPPTPTPTTSGNFPSSGLSESQTSAGCIVIDAVSDLVSPISSGWVVDSDGMTFRKWDDTESITNGGQSPLYYTVTATRNSRFGLSVDMTTRKHAEHNDIWLRFQPGNLQAMREHKVRNITGWVKGYHNEYGRATMIYTTDFDPHSLSTGIELRAGESYSLGISGRSSKLTVHHIVLFPCYGYTCQDSDAFWKTSLNLCLPNSN